MMIGESQLKRSGSSPFAVEGRMSTVSPPVYFTVMPLLRMPVEPELQFQPEAEASYDLAAQVLNIIKGSGVTKFGFVGNEQYRVFGAGGPKNPTASAG